MIIIKTRKGNEFIVKTYLEERNIKAEARPQGYLGLVLAYTDDLNEVLNIPEVEHAYLVRKRVDADLDKIVEACKEFADEIKNCNSFAVETVRRGKHDFTSVDVNVRCVRALKELTGCDINYKFPEKLIRVEIINRDAYLCIVDGKEIKRKYTPEKLSCLELFNKIVFVQMPYWGSLDGCYEMGKRIGRAAQSFEISKLIIANHDEINALEFYQFLKGVLEGIKARIFIQKRAYPREITQVEVTIENLFQIIRKLNPKKHLIIITDPLGEQVTKVKDKLKKDLKNYEKIYIFAGSREGIPKGLFRFAHYVLDLAPGITFATEHTIPTSLISLYTIYSESE